MIQLCKIKLPYVNVNHTVSFRSIRWLDRCIKANKRPTEQKLFAIVQGGLNPDLRKRCAEGLDLAITCVVSPNLQL